MGNPQRSKQKVVRPAKFILANPGTAFHLGSSAGAFSCWQRRCTLKAGTAGASAKLSRDERCPPAFDTNLELPELHLNGPGPHRGDWLSKYMALPPQQQEQQLRQDPAFRSLPADKQNHLLDRLRKVQQPAPGEEGQILNRMETFEHMTPEQQTAARNLFARYRSLPDDQKAKVSQAYRRLRGMPPSGAEPVAEF